VLFGFGSMTLVLRFDDITTRTVYRPTQSAFERCDPSSDHKASMRSDHPTTPFDVEVDDAANDAEMIEQFWGAPKRGSGRVSARDTNGDLWRDNTGAIRTILDGVAAFRPRTSGRTDISGEVQRTREHRIVPARGADSSALPPESDDLWEWDDELDAYLEVEAAARTEHRSSENGSLHRISLGAAGPLLRYVGLILLVALLLVPLALALRPSEAPATLVEIESSGVGSENPVQSTDPSIADVRDEPRSDVAPEAIAPAAKIDESSIDPPIVGAVVERTTVEAQVAAAQAVPDIATPEVTATSSAETVEVVTVSATAERVVPECPQIYVAGQGDSWFRIADAANVTSGALLRENRATVDTVIFPGDEICLPSGATMPSQPTPTTDPPISTTVVPPTTTPPTTAPPASTAQVQQIIRDIWPDELEQKALDIAWIESRFVATAFNGTCCYGVFQIYWTVHQSWLDELGINSSSDLFNARKNIEAAYVLYQRAGGWGPWGG
jgi:LysM repeat protein